MTSLGYVRPPPVRTPATPRLGSRAVRRRPTPESRRPSPVAAPVAAGPRVLLALSGAALVAVCAANYAPDCRTVSCTSDAGELADRAGAAALTAQAAGTYAVWTERGVPRAAAGADAALLLALALASADVAGDAAHNYVALAFGVVRMVLTAAALRGGITRAQLVALALLRSLALVFVVGDACPRVIPEVCASLGADAALSPLATFVCELGFVVCGVAYLALDGVGAPWRGDRAVAAVFALGAVLHAAAGVAALAPGGLLMLLPTGLDATVAWRTRGGPPDWPFACAIAGIALPASAYAFA